MLKDVGSRGGRASEQLGGQENMRGLGACYPRKIVKFACSEIESGVIWRRLKPSTHISEVK